MADTHDSGSCGHMPPVRVQVRPGFQIFNRGRTTSSFFVFLPTRTKKNLCQIALPPKGFSDDLFCSIEHVLEVRQSRFPEEVFLRRKTPFRNNDLHMIGNYLLDIFEQTFNYRTGPFRVSERERPEGQAPLWRSSRNVVYNSPELSLAPQGSHTHVVLLKARSRNRVCGCGVSERFVFGSKCSRGVLP